MGQAGQRKRAANRAGLKFREERPPNRGEIPERAGEILSRAEAGRFRPLPCFFVERPCRAFPRHVAPPRLWSGRTRPPENVAGRQATGSKRSASMAVSRGYHFFQNPGPTNIPDRVLRAMDRGTIDFT